MKKVIRMIALTIISAIFCIFTIKNVKAETLEMRYQNNKYQYTNDKERRKIVLNNYFKETTNNLKFPSKYQMEKALKNINYEMEKASQEFSKLFNYDNDKKL